MEIYYLASIAWRKHILDKVDGFAIVSTCLPEYPSADNDYEYKATKENNEDNTNIFKSINNSKNVEQNDFGFKF